MVPYDSQITLNDVNRYEIWTAICQMLNHMH